MPCAAVEPVTPKWVLMEVSAGLYMVSMICGNINNVTANGIEILLILLFI